MIVNVKVNNTPSKIHKGFMVARLDIREGRASLWYYGTYDTEERAHEVASELGNGVVMEV